jgi:hypothetical protein
MIEVTLPEISELFAKKHENSSKSGPVLVFFVKSHFQSNSLL